MSRRRATFDEWMSADAMHTASDPLTPEQQEVFDRGYRACREHAVAVARKVGGSGNAEDIVQGAILRLIHLVTRREDRQPMPADEAEFEKRLVGLVYLVGKASVSPSRSAMSGRKVGERLLTRDMVSLDEVELELPVELEELPDKERALGFLRVILIWNVYRLGVMQVQVLRDHVCEIPRAEAAAKLGISVKTFDNTLRRAKDRMRECVLTTALWEDIRFRALSDWMEIFYEMECRRVEGLFKKKKEQRQQKERNTQPTSTQEVA